MIFGVLKIFSGKILIFFTSRTPTAGGHICQLIHMMTHARTHASRTLYIAPTVFYYSVASQLTEVLHTVKMSRKRGVDEEQIRALLECTSNSQGNLVYVFSGKAITTKINIKIILLGRSS